MTNLEQSETRIPDVWSIKLTFSLTVTFYLAIFWQKKADMSKIKGVLVLKGIFSETTYVSLSTKFEVCNEPLKSPPSLGLITKSSRIFNTHFINFERMKKT